MKEKFKKHFEALQEGGAFKGLSFDDLNDEQSQELFTSYLDTLDEAIKETQRKLDESNGENETVKQELKTLKDEMSKESKDYATMTYNLAKSATANLVNISTSPLDPKKAKLIEEAKKVYSDVVEAQKTGVSNEFTVKIEAVKAATLTTSVLDSTIGERDPDIARLAHRKITAADAITSKPIVRRDMGGKWQYTDQSAASSVRAAAQVAEGGTYPESTIAWVEKEIKLKKVADSIPYSDEFFYDFNMLMNEISNFLRVNIDLQEDDQIINGDGTGENYSGYLASIPDFVPVASGIDDPNIFDLACKVSEDITALEGSKYQPNLIHLNSSDIVSINYMLKKDANNNYIPIDEKLRAKGFVVVENNSLASDNMILGDNRFVHLINDGMVTIRTGVKVNNNDLEGISHVSISTRKNVLIKDLEKTSFRHVTSISAALTVLGS